MPSGPAGTLRRRAKTPLMLPALIATDVDGTLLSPDEIVTERTRAAVRAAVESGVMFVLATGRPPRWIPPVVEQLGFAPMSVCANGAVVWKGQTGASGTWDIFFYDGTITKRLTWNNLEDSDPCISGDGSIIAWEKEQYDWRVSGSVIQEQYRAASDMFNSLCVLLLPLALVALWKRSGSNRA